MNAGALTQLVAQSSGRVHQAEMDITDDRSIASAAATVGKVLAGWGLNVLVRLTWTPPFRTNVTSAHMVMSAFLALSKHGTLKKVINIFSTFGSIARASRSSFAREGFIFMIISPGWVKTDLGGNNVELTPEQSATAVLVPISSATSAYNSKFYDTYVDGLDFHDGSEVPWQLPGSFGA
ncbi:hypothetical protein ASPACDRAFT_45041 [Aspergillus aculeatus ATCC 16872]|uniref:Ketoreductase (KR) domain-containing protein n=1 Tax=Aspergillus aculeatus (strain ATCC 16872 / CBS 172.66 / WB 5094) TaxID=690307 RepID=A0A1L9WQZ1_ASPA1|nr:uncharacterized protein ASPACDRAFT_45041 [Aspergillus aculeatus ATCC 16872]OJJ98528.1 hypothetical protein ASPACDRAFT_45041 [Aspergillus aculeatus ATCC 16872]